MRGAYANRGVGAEELSEGAGVDLRNDPRRRLAAIIALAIVVSGCASGGATDGDGGTIESLSADLLEAGEPPELDADVLSDGAALYSQFCTSCHKADLSGEPNWKTRHEDGSYPAPPHDASGHTWHHSDQLLLTIIRDGLDSGATNMPTYAGTLTDAEIMSIVEFFKSSWPPEERLFQWQTTWQESQGDR